MSLGPWGRRWGDERKEDKPHEKDDKPKGFYMRKGKNGMPGRSCHKYMVQRSDEAMFFILQGVLHAPEFPSYKKKGSEMDIYSLRDIWCFWNYSWRTDAREIQKNWWLTLHCWCCNCPTCAAWPVHHSMAIIETGGKHWDWLLQSPVKWQMRACGKPWLSYD